MFAAVSCLICFSVYFSSTMKQIMADYSPKELIGGYDLVARDGRPLITESILEQMKETDEYDELPPFQLTAVQQLLWKEVKKDWGTFEYKVNGIDEQFAETNQIPLYVRDDRFTNDRQTWRELAANKDAVILSADILYDAEGQRYDIGDPYPVRVGNKTVSKTIIGVAHITGYHPQSYGIWLHRDALAALAKDEHAIHSTVFIALPEGTTAADIERIETLLTMQSIYPVTKIVESEYNYYLTMIYIMRLLQVFNMVALCIGFSGVMVVMYRLIHQRSRQIAMLRAVSVQSGTILQSFLLEGFLTSSFGLLVGFGSGTYMANIVFATLFAQDMQSSLVIPIGEIALFSFAAAVCALTFSYLPARKALRVSPVEANRITS